MGLTDLGPLEALIDLMRRKGVAVVKYEGAEVVLGPEPAPAAPVVTVDSLSLGKPAPDTIAPPGVLDREPGYDDILFAATRGFADEQPPGGGPQ